MRPFHIILQSTTPWPCSFEEAVADLEQLPRMFIELDGSFVWRADDELAWQIDGCLFDRAGGLLYVELKGTCPQKCFELLLGCLRGVPEALTVQLVREAQLLSLEGFRGRFLE